MSKALDGIDITSEDLYTFYVRTEEVTGEIDGIVGKAWKARPLNLKTFPEVWDTLTPELQKEAALNFLLTASR